MKDPHRAISVRLKDPEVKYGFIASRKGVQEVQNKNMCSGFQKYKDI